MVKLPVKISEEEGESRTNVTSFEIPVIVHFDGDVEDIMEILLDLRSRIIKHRQLEDFNKEVKLTLKIPGIIFVSNIARSKQNRVQTCLPRVLGNLS